MVAGALGLLFYMGATAMSFVADRRASAHLTRLRGRDPHDLTAFEGIELDPIHRELLDIGQALKRRERELAEGDALLGAIVEMTPAALLLLESRGGVLATNEASRTLFFDGDNVVGLGMTDLLRRATPLLRHALAATGDELVLVEDADGASCTRHLVKRHFELGGKDVVLVMLSDLSREIARQEAEVYRRVIRVLSHEVNNSLAPISSLMHSAKMLANGDTDKRLLKLFDTVAGRAEHLRRFLQGYSELARLPPPRKETVAWASFFERIGELYPGIRVANEKSASLAESGIALSGIAESGIALSGWFDRAQIEQVMVNLIKNAEEAGSERSEIHVKVDASAGHGTRISVGDRGRGMTPEVMKNALVPLFSTKESGRGLGLALCREIIEAHGGTLWFKARAGGGLEVVVRLPPRSHAKVRNFSTHPTTATRG